MTTIIGIAGGTASGKSTAARALHKHLGERSVWLMHDRYYRTIPEAFRSDPTQFNFDHPDALDTPRLVADLKTLLQGQSVSVPAYDFATHERVDPTRWERIAPRPIIIVEGILVLADPELRRVMHHKVYVHAPDDIRLARRMLRDVQERGRTVSDVVEQYMRTVRPMHTLFVGPSRAHADLVLDGTRKVDHLVSSMLELLDA